MFLSNAHTLPDDWYVSVALAPSTVMPAPSAAPSFAAPLATVIFLSSTSNVVVLSVVVVPLTCRLPDTVRSPLTVTSSGRPTVTVSVAETVTSTSLAVPCMVSVSVSPTVCVEVPSVTLNVMSLVGNGPASIVDVSLKVSVRLPADVDASVTETPCSPWIPCMPCGPVSPCGPVAPVSPCMPCMPCGPVAPVSPCMPCGPVAPVSPCMPCMPCGPMTLPASMVEASLSVTIKLPLPFTVADVTFRPSAPSAPSAPSLPTTKPASTVEASVLVMIRLPDSFIATVSMPMPSSSTAL